ncbi:MAG TPA: hypothetical protein VF540_04885, partial [Segetibacter sp.]|jgi:hypothetical protein
MRPANIASLTRDKFKGLVNKYLESEYCDAYIKKEHLLGFFNQDGIFEQYLENSKEIFSEAEELFRDYYSQ